MLSEVLNVAERKWFFCNWKGRTRHWSRECQWGGENGGQSRDTWGWRWEEWASALHSNDQPHPQYTILLELIKSRSDPNCRYFQGGGAKMTFTAASPTKENSLDTWKGGWTAMWESSIDVTESLTCYELSVLVQCFEMWNLVLDQTFKSHESELRTAGTRHYVGWSWDESVWGK